MAAIPLIGGSKKLSALALTPVLGFGLMLGCVKLLGMEPWEAAKLAMFLCASGPGYTVMEGIRDIKGKGK